MPASMLELEPIWLIITILTWHSGIRCRHWWRRNLRHDLQWWSNNCRWYSLNRNDLRRLLTLLLWGVPSCLSCSCHTLACRRRFSLWAWLFPCEQRTALCFLLADHLLSLTYLILREGNLRCLHMLGTATIDPEGLPNLLLQDRVDRHLPVPCDPSVLLCYTFLVLGPRGVQSERFASFSIIGMGSLQACRI